MVSMMKLDYLTSGGDPTWLNGLQFTTQKIRNLAKLNGLMAHQPWLLKPRHIQELVCRESNHNPHNVWTISELAQVMVIMSTVHSISVLVAACGIVPEIDMIGGTFVDLSKLQNARKAEEGAISPLSMLPSPRVDADPTKTAAGDQGILAQSLFQYEITLPPQPVTKRTYDEVTSKLHTAELIRRLLTEREACGTDGEESEMDSDACGQGHDSGLPRGFEEVEDSKFFNSLFSAVHVWPLFLKLIVSTDPCFQLSHPQNHASFLHHRQHAKPFPVLTNPRRRT